jgi:minor histocompatibility antigen H13
MLGLGDVVIPGLFISLALRYDYHMFQTLQQKKDSSSPQVTYPKPYFYAGLIAYVSGLVVTMTVMHTYQKAQPALLYLR